MFAKLNFLRFKKVDVGDIMSICEEFKIKTRMISKMMPDKRKEKLIIAAFAIFLFLVLQYKWQLAVSKNYLELGNGNYEAKNYIEALKNYKYASIIDGGREVVYLARLRRAEIFYKSGRLDDAEEESREALREKANDYKVYGVLADILYERKDFDNAINYYKKALSLIGERDDGYLNVRMAKSLMAKGNFSDARAVFTDFYSKNGENEEVSYYLGLLEFNENISDNIYLEKLTESDNGKYNIPARKVRNFISHYDKYENGDYNNVLIADLYNKIGEPYLAIGRIGSVLKNNQNYRDAWMVSGKSNFIVEDYKKSLDDFSKALELDGHNYEIYFWLGGIYEKLGDISKSNEFFEKSRLLSV